MPKTMAHKKKNEEKQKTAPYTIEDAMKIADEVLKLSKDNEYNVGAFVHGLVFALEFAQYTYQIPQQQLANIRRDCRKFLQNANRI